MVWSDNMVEVIKEGEIIRMSEARAVEEDFFILRKVIEPEKEVISEFPVPRLIAEEKKDVVKSYNKLESWKAGKFNYSKNNVVDDLVDNFQWVISRRRREKGYTRKQVADAIGFTEENIKSMELGELPRDDFILINKIEGYLKINLRKEKRTDEATLADLQKMNETKVLEEIGKTHFREAQDKDVKFSGEDIEILDS